MRYVGNRNTLQTNLFTIKYYLIYDIKSIRNANEKVRFSCLFNNKRQLEMTAAAWFRNLGKPYGSHLQLSTSGRSAPYSRI